MPVPDETVGAAAATALPTLLRATFGCETAARAGDPEAGIHDMRVAAKRLREALRLFSPAFRRRDAKRHLRWIDGLNDALGGVRELDVTMARLESRARKLGEPPGMRELIERLGRARSGAQLWLLWHLDDIRAKERVPRLEARLVRIRARAAQPGEPASQPLAEFVRGAILERLAGVRRRWDRAHVDARERTLHRLRIANKRLRYAIEPFRTGLPQEVRDACKLSSKLHDALGDLHDEEVLLHRIETALIGAANDGRPAWEKLARDATRRRARHLAKVAALGDRVVPAWDAMARSLEARPEPVIPVPELPARELDELDSSASRERSPGETRH